MMAFYWYWWKRVTKPKPGVSTPVRTNVGGTPLKYSVRSEPIVGYRLWRVRPTQTGLSLWSLNTQYEWEQTNTAECRPSPAGMLPYRMEAPPTHDDPAPSINHSCGFYTSLPDQPLEEWLHTVRGKVHASGTVALTGRVLKCSMGFKAEHAEIQSPVVLDVYCASSPECNGDVVSVDLQADSARGWCEEHAPGQGALVEVSAYMAEACRQLHARYPLVEFLSWYTLEGET